MTTTYDHETFYKNLKEAILETIQKKYTLFSLLPEQQDIIQRKEALVDMLTIFSFQDSIIASSGTDPSSLDANIQQAIVDYYRHVGDGEVVGVTPSDRMMDELVDMAYIIQPKFPTEYFTEFITNQGLTEEDEDDIAKAPLQTCVIASMLVVIKSEMMFVEFASMLKGFGKEKRQGAKVG